MKLSFHSAAGTSHIWPGRGAWRAILGGHEAIGWLVNYAVTQTPIPPA